jgi:hypothetical protein
MRPRFPMVLHPSRQSRECFQGISSHRLFNHKIGRALDVTGAASPTFAASGHKNTPVKILAFPLATLTRLKTIFYIFQGGLLICFL